MVGGVRCKGRNVLCDGCDGDNDGAKLSRKIAPPPGCKQPTATKCRIGKNAHQSTPARTNRHTGAHELTRRGDESGSHYPAGSGRRDRITGESGRSMCPSIRESTPRQYYFTNRGERPLVRLCGYVTNDAHSRNCNSEKRSTANIHEGADAVGGLGFESHRDYFPLLVVSADEGERCPEPFGQRRAAVGRLMSLVRAQGPREARRLAAGRSKRSRFITLVQAAMKSFTNFSSPSCDA